MNKFYSSHLFENVVWAENSLESRQVFLVVGVATWFDVRLCLERRRLCNVFCGIVIIADTKVSSSENQSQSFCIVMEAFGHEKWTSSLIDVAQSDGREKYFVQRRPAKNRAYNHKLSSLNYFKVRSVHSCFYHIFLKKNPTYRQHSWTKPTSCIVQTTSQKFPTIYNEWLGWAGKVSG